MDCLNPRNDEPKKSFFITTKNTPMTPLYPLTNKRIWIAGHRGMVGGALVRRLAAENCTVLTVGRDTVDMRDQSAVRRWIAQEKPDAVIIAAAKVGGILANSQYPADFLYDNLMIASNIIEASAKVGVKKLLFLGSTCIYPKFAPQPIDEESLLTGALEPTNEWYAIAKIAGIKLCQAWRQQHGCDFISAQPTNLYGHGDNFDLSSSHVLPALLRKAHEAKEQNQPTLTVWGSGTPRREFLYVDDLADALIFLLQHYSDSLPLNIGTGEDITIRDLATTITRIVDFQGELAFDTSKPDGTPRKLTSVQRLHALGWKARTGLEEGVASTYQWFLQNAYHNKAA
jgi:GDP-L-fucose synthase